MDVQFIEYITPLLTFGNIFGMTFFTLKGQAPKGAILFIFPLLFTGFCLFYLISGLVKATETSYILSITALIATSILRVPNYYYFKNQLRSLILNINNMNGKLKIGSYNRKRMLLCICYLILFCIFFGIFDLVLLIFDGANNTSILLYYVYSVLIGVNFVETFLMYVLLKQFGRQFARINWELGRNIDFINLDAKIKPRSSKVVKNNKRLNDLKNKERGMYFKRIYELADFHFTIINHCKVANEVFALPSLYILGTEFTILVALIQDLAIVIHKLASGAKAYTSIQGCAISVYWTIIIMLHFYYFIEVYRFVTKESTKTSTHIHQIWNTLATNDELDEQCNHLQLIAMQMLNNKISFTARGLFPLDRTLLQRVINATAIYVVILVQFYLSDQKKKQKKN